MDFPSDFVEERKLINAEDSRHIYSYKDQIWIIVTNGLDYENIFKGTSLEGKHTMTDELFQRIRGFRSKDYNFLHERAKGFFEAEVSSYEKYASNIIFLSDKTDRIPQLIFKGFLNPNLFLFVITRVPGTHIWESKLPSHMFIKAILDAFDYVEGLYHRYGYKFNDSHWGNWLVDDTGKSYYIDFEDNTIEPIPRPNESQVFQMMNRTEDFFPYSNHYDITSDEQDEPWNIERNFLVKLYEYALCVKNVSDTFFGYQMRDPLMKIMAPILFQAFIEHESSNAKDAFHFTMTCLCPRVLHFLQPLRSQKLIEVVNNKLKELNTNRIINSDMSRYASFDDYTLPSEDHPIKYKFILDGKHIAYTYDGSKGAILCFSVPLPYRAEVIDE